MAIIYTYGYDDNVQDGDAWIGTNASNRKTKQFTVASVANYLNRAGRISIGGQMTFKFVTLTPATGTISLPTLGGDGTNFTDIASLYVSAIDTSGANVTEWLDYLVGQELLISEQQEPNNFGHYRITSYTVDANPSFYTLVLTDIGGYGTIKADTYYNLNNINLVTGTTDPTGLEAINEGNGIGWRLIGRDADNYGPIGLNAIDFSNSNSISTERGSTGENSITFGNNNINQQSGSIVLGGNQSVKITDTFQGANIITGFDNFIWGATYSSLIAAYRSTIGVEGTNYTTNALYQSLIVGDGHNYYAGRDSGVVGGGLISGSTACFTVGMANEDLTTTTSNWLTAQYNNYGPRFIVGVGNYNPVSQTASIRQNGFVVMSDGTATFPVLSNAMIDSAGDDSAVTKGWVNSGPALTSEQVRIEVKNTSGVTLVKGTPVYITGTVGATIRAEVAAADASSSATMPAVGVLAQDLINNADGFAITGGFLSNVTTDPIDGITPVANQTVYVKPGGGLTLTKPTGSNLIQNIAKVGKISGGSAGSLVISSILRTNDVPNLTTGKIWVGTATNTTESGVVYLDEGNGYMGIGTTTPATKLDVVGNSEFNGEVRISSNNVHVNDKLLNIVDGGTGKEGIHIRTGQPTIDFQDWNTGGKGEITSDNGNISIQSDVTNTKASSNITFLVDASERMRITDAGNVGIGTTSPSALLEVAGDLNLYNPSTTSQITFRDIAGSNYIKSNGYATQLGLRGNAGNGVFILEDVFGTTQDLRIKPTTGGWDLSSRGVAGVNALLTIDTVLNVSAKTNVGIGTTSPTYKLDIAQTAPNTTALALQNDLGNYNVKIGDNSRAGLISLFDSTGVIEKIKINGGGNSYFNGGNVGIGTTSPTYRLELGSGDFSLPLGSIIRFGGQLGITKANIGKLSIYGGTGATTAGGIDLYRWNGAAYSTALRLSNTGQLQFDEYGSGTFTGTATQRLAVDSSGNVIEIPIGSGPVDGSGTANYVTKWSDADTITDSVIYDDGTNIGIGTTSPSEKLHVSGSFLVEAGTSTPYIKGNQLRVSTSTNLAYGILRLGSVNDIVGDVGTYSFKNGTTTLMRIANTGDVGIGTTFPLAKLHIEGGDIYAINNGGDPRLVLGDSVSTGGWGYIQWKSSSDRIDIGTSGTPALSVKEDGNVGIGTTSPAYKLDVDCGTDNQSALFRSTDVQNSIGLTDSGTTLVTSVGVGVVGDDMYLYAGSTSYQQRLRIQGSTGNVGIGTTTPATTLEVAGVTTVRKSGIATPHADTDLLVTDATAAGSTAQVQILGGNAGNSHLYFSDTDNYSQGGIQYLHASDSMNIRVNATTAVTIDSSRNVGIGTTSPATLLNLSDNDPDLRFDDTSALTRADLNTEIGFYDSTGANGSYIGHRNSADLAIRSAAGAIRLGTFANSQLVNLVGSSVGIGTTSPTDLLHIEGASTPTLKIVDTTNTTITELYSNDFDTYLANESSGRVFIRTGGSNGFVVDSAGDVGIGTTNPIYKLDIQAESPAIRIQDISDANSFLVGADNSGGYLGMFTNDSLRVYTNSLERMRITDTGNVGIGTTSPAAKLEIGSTENVAAIINSTNTFTFLDLENDGINRVQIGNASDGDFIIRTADTERLRVTSTGNVGIGTSNPTHRLYVQGNNGPLLVTREITTPNQARIGIGENNPSSAITFGSYSDRTITGAAGLRFVNGARISELNTTRLAFQAGAGYFFYPIGTNPSGDVYGVDIRHLRDSAVNTTDAVLEVNNSANSSLMLVRSDGRVGIATTSPASKLHVQGDTYIQNGNLLMSAGVYGIANVGNIAQKAGFPSSGNFAFQSVDVGIGTTTPAAKLDVNGGVRIADDAAVASATNVGTLRYRTSGNNSYVDMCMQTGPATYAWVNIVQNNW